MIGETPGPAQLRERSSARDHGEPARLAFPFAVECDGALDRSFVERTVAQLARRLNVERPGVETLDVPADECAAVVRELAASAASAPAADGAPLLAWLLRVGDSRHVLLVVVRDIAVDKSAIPAWFADACAVARNAEPLRGASRVESRSGPLPPPPVLPIDRPRGARSDPRARTFRQELAPPLVAGLDAVAERCGATRFVVVLAALAVLARRYTGSDEFAVGVARDGCGLVPLRIDRAGDIPFGAFVERVDADLAAGSLHPGAASLARFVVGDASTDRPVTISGMTLGVVPVDAPTGVGELGVFLDGRPDAVELVWEYRSQLYDDATIARLAANLEVLVGSCVARDGLSTAIDDLDAVHPAEHRWLVETLNATDTPAPLDRGLDDLLADAFARFAVRPALVGGGRELTYGDVDAESTRLAGALAEAGVSLGDAVLVCGERDPTRVVAVVAAIKAGAYYVPVDPQLPAARMRVMQQLTNARVAVATSESAAALRELPCAVLDYDAAPEGRVHGFPRRTPESICYAMFTSGSTGVPKCVAVPDRGVVRLVRAQTFMSVSPADTFMHVSSFSFDAATLEIWGALLNGALLAVPSDDAVKDPRELGRSLAAHRVTIGFFNVAVLRRLLDAAPDSLSSFRTLIVGGEAVPTPLVRQAAKHVEARVLVNGYGPTENTTFSCCHRLAEVPAPGTTVPIGRPIANSRAYVVDAKLRPVPVGAVGEIVVGGAGVALGYLNDAKATAAKFVDDAFSGRGKLYRTGDHGRVLPSGSLEYLGRTDDQVKIRGFRVQLAEVEHLLGRVSGVRRAVAVAHDGEHGRQLLGFVEAQTGVRADDVRTALAREVPDYLIPAHIVVVPEFPVTANGKVDRRALLELRQRAQTRRPEPARTELERRLAEIWCDVLDLDDVGVDDPFFEVGGDSLLLAVLRDRIAAELGESLPVAALLEYPTIKSLADRLRREPPDGRDAVHARARARVEARRRLRRSGDDGDGR